MKLKTLSLIAGAIALTLTATSFAVQAEISSSPSLLAQTQTPKRGKKGPWQSLGLTEAQQAQIQQIQRNTRTQIEAVFTPEQKAKIQAAMEARRAQRQAGERPQRGQGQWKNFAELNLTQAQKDQIRQIRESSKKQMEAVLTPEQQAKLQQLKETARQRRQQRQQGDR